MKEPDMELKKRNAAGNVGNTNNTRQPTGRRVVGPPTKTNWSAEQRKEFCDAVFSARDVHSMLGFDAKTLANVQTIPVKTMARTAGCRYNLPSKPKRPPLYAAQMMIDCRRGVVHTPEMTKRGVMVGKKAEKIEAVTVGMGGTYAHFLLTMGKYKAPIHQINFIHEKPKCSLTVRTQYIAKEHARDLARHVDRRVDESNAPHK